MRTKIYFGILFFLIGISLQVFAQAPQSFNYQSVVRNANGTVLGNQAVKLRLSITDAASGGNILYRESHSLTTNQFGLVAAAVGGGTVLNGSFAAINWGAGSRYLQVEVDPTGGNTFADMGTAQLLSVPYALYAETSGNSAVGPTGAVGATGPTGAQGVTGATGATGTSGQAGDRYTTTSSSSLSISNGAKTLTVGTGLSYAVGQTVIIANSATNVMTGTVTAYNGTTGAMSVTVTSVTGSGTFTSWTVALNGAPGPAGPTGAGATGPTGATGTFGVTGTTGQTLHHTGAAWAATSNLYNNGTRVGIGTTSPVARLHVADSSVVFSAAGEFSSSNSPFISGGGRRMMWYAEKGAFRAGYVLGGLWNKDSIGWHSFAAGRETKASGWASAAIGEGTIAACRGEIAVGRYNTEHPTPNGGVLVQLSNRVFVVGAGLNEQSRSDVLEILQNGDVKIGSKGTFFTNLQEGEFFAGTSSIQKKTVAITFPKPFTNAANVRLSVTPRNDPSWAPTPTDVFAVTLGEVTTTTAIVYIYRLDANNWAQNLRLNWMAWE